MLAFQVVSIYFIAATSSIAKEKASDVSVRYYEAKKCGEQYYCIKTHITLTKNLIVYENGNFILYVLETSPVSSQITIDAYMIVPRIYFEENNGKITVSFVDNTQIMAECYLDAFMTNKNALKSSTCCIDGETKISKSDIDTNYLWTPDITREALMFCIVEDKTIEFSYRCYLAALKELYTSDKYDIFVEIEKIRSSTKTLITSINNDNYVTESAKVLKYKYSFHAAKKFHKYKSKVMVFIESGELTCEQKIDVDHQTSPITKVDNPLSAGISINKVGNKLIFCGIGPRKIHIFNSGKELEKEAINNECLNSGIFTDQTDGYKLEFGHDALSTSITLDIRERTLFSGFMHTWKYIVDSTGKITSEISDYVSSSSFSMVVMPILNKLDPLRIKVEDKLVKEIEFEILSKEKYLSSVFNSCSGQVDSSKAGKSTTDDYYRHHFKLSDNNILDLDTCFHALITVKNQLSGDSREYSIKVSMGDDSLVAIEDVSSTYVQNGRHSTAFADILASEKNKYTDKISIVIPKDLPKPSAQNIPIINESSEQEKVDITVKKPAADNTQIETAKGESNEIVNPTAESRDMTQTEINEESKAPEKIEFIRKTGQNISQDPKFYVKRRTDDDDQMNKLNPDQKSTDLVETSQDSRPDNVFELQPSELSSKEDALKSTHGKEDESPGEISVSDERVKKNLNNENTKSLDQFKRSKKQVTGHEESSEKAADEKGLNEIKAIVGDIHKTERCETEAKAVNSDRKETGVAGTDEAASDLQLQEETIKKRKETEKEEEKKANLPAPESPETQETNTKEVKVKETVKEGEDQKLAKGTNQAGGIQGKSEVEAAQQQSDIRNDVRNPEKTVDTSKDKLEDLSNTIPSTPDASIQEVNSKDRIVKPDEKPTKSNQYSEERDRKRYSDNENTKKTPVDVKSVDTHVLHDSSIPENSQVVKNGINLDRPETMTKEVIGDRSNIDISLKVLSDFKPASKSYGDKDDNDKDVRDIKPSTDLSATIKPNLVPNTEDLKNDGTNIEEIQKIIKSISGSINLDELVEEEKVLGKVKYENLTMEEIEKETTAAKRKREERENVEFGIIEKRLSSLKANVKSENLIVTHFEVVDADRPIMMEINHKIVDKSPKEEHQPIKSSVKISGSLVQGKKNTTIAYYHVDTKLRKRFASGIVMISGISNNKTQGNEAGESYIELVFNLSTTTISQSNFVCSWIRVNMKEFKTDGCETSYNYDLQNPYTLVTCKCNHLTSFAVLVGADYKSKNIHIERSASVLTYFCTSISVALLIIVVCRKLKEAKSAKNIGIIYLAMNYLGIYISFLLAIAAANHYSVCFIMKYVTSFFIIHLYATIGFYGYRAYKNLVCLTLQKNWMMRRRGFLFPSVIAGIWISAIYYLTNSEKTDECFLSAKSSRLFILPFFGIIIMFNCVISIKASLKIRIRLKDIKEKRHEEIKRNLLLHLILTLGFCWILQLMIPIHYIFKHLFVMINSSQGLLLYLNVCKFDNTVFSLSNSQSYRIQKAGSMPLKSSNSHVPKLRFSNI